MKIVVLALLVILLASQGEALRCYCGGRRQCHGNIETCATSDEATCGAVIFEVGYPPSYFKGCMTKFSCQLLNRPGISSAACCSTDLCNR